MKAPGRSPGVVDPADLTAASVVVLVVTVKVVALLLRGVMGIAPYQQGVVIVLGSFRRTLNPGVSFLPLLGRVVRVDLRPTWVDLRTVRAPDLSGALREGSLRVEYPVERAPAAVFGVPSVPEGVRRAGPDALREAWRATEAAEQLPAAGGAIAWRSRNARVPRAEKFGLRIGRVYLVGPVGGSPAELAVGPSLGDPGGSAPVPSAPRPFA